MCSNLLGLLNLLKGVLSSRGCKYVLWFTHGHRQRGCSISLMDGQGLHLSYCGLGRSSPNPRVNQLFLGSWQHEELPWSLWKEWLFLKCLWGVRKPYFKSGSHHHSLTAHNWSGCQGASCCPSLTLEGHGEGEHRSIPFWGRRDSYVGLNVVLQNVVLPRISYENAIIL